ncbi:MAG: hypothetical protein MMC33_010536 [Icmadophila ericetorum]|nr:hypothetical protein [Icmadophila ericetorum]
MHPFFTYSFRNHYFEYSWYNLELLRLLGSAPYGGCDAAEFLETVALLEPNNAVSWQRRWLTLAERTYDLAEEMMQCGHTSSARNTYLRASNYFRCAQYLFPIMPESDQLYLLRLYQRSIACFERAMTLMSHKVCRVEIPYQLKEGRTIHLPGWLHQPNPSQRLAGRKTPVLICVGGADSTQEELYFMSVAEGPDLGYAILTFDGPGQGLVLRREGVHMQPDGEVVLGSVLDFIESYAGKHPEAQLDLDALTVTGQSLGGFQALRGAADKRIKACVAVDPFYDMWDLAMARMPSWMVAPWDSGWIGDWMIDWAARTHGGQDIATRYQFALAQRMFGTSNPGSTLRAMKQYTFKLGAEDRSGKGGKDYLERVKCPVLVTAAAADPTSFLPELSTDAIMKNLVSVGKGQKKLWVAKAYSEGGAQAKSGAWHLLQHRAFRFLDEALGIKRAQAHSVC